MSFVEKFYNELKSRNVEILPPIYIVNSSRIELHGLSFQFTVADEAYYKTLLDECLEASPGKLQFVELILPKAKHIDEALLLVKENVLLRYIKAHDVKTGEPIERWDALIKV